MARASRFQQHDRRLLDRRGEPPGTASRPVSASIFLYLIRCLVLHQATAMWDVSFAASRREVKPIEQHINGVLEMMPLTGLLIVIALHWEAFIALFGLAPS